MGGFDAVAIQAHPDVKRWACPPRRQFVRHRRRRRGGARRQQARRQSSGPYAARENPGLRQYRLGPGADADRPDRRDAKAPEAREDGARRHRSGRDQRGVRLRRAALLRALDLDPEKVNVNGGAIAMGHPLGATGAMILGTALDELERRDLFTALVTLCIGAGMGTATIIERV